MPDTTTADEPGRRRKPRKNAPKLRDGVMKRGHTWSYVIRVKDPETGVSKPRWVGGFATEEAAKAARDENRVKAHRGEYIDHNRITVAAYLADWIDSHAMEIKPAHCSTTGPASGSMSRRASATCRSRPCAPPRSPSSTVTC
jgi:hypothetical protein